MEMYVNSFEPEERSGHLVSSQIKKLWNIQLILATELLAVCKKHNLKIWASDGTALGAIRHKGFIPWDDDMDFMMMREDYDKLLKIAPTEIKSPFFFQCAYTEQGYYRGHAQMRYNDTTMILPEEAHLGKSFHQGVFIDIFVADGVPENDAELDSLATMRSQILTYLNFRNTPSYPRFSPNYLLSFLKAKKALGEMAQWDDIRLYSYLEELFRKTPAKSARQISTIMFTSLKSLYADPHWFDEIIWMPFEKTSIPVSAEYDRYLTSRYGDYMKPVKGGTVHGTLLLDTEKSYKEYLKQLRYSGLHIKIHFIKSIFSRAFRKVFK